MLAALSQMLGSTGVSGCPRQNNGAAASKGPACKGLHLFDHTRVSTRTPPAGRAGARPAGAGRQPAGAHQGVRLPRDPHPGRAPAGAPDPGRAGLHPCRPAHHPHRPEARERDAVRGAAAAPVAAARARAARAGRRGLAQRPARHRPVPTAHPPCKGSLKQRCRLRGLCVVGWEQRSACGSARVRGAQLQWPLFSLLSATLCTRADSSMRTVWPAIPQGWPGSFMWEPGCYC